MNGRALEIDDDESEIQAAVAASLEDMRSSDAATSQGSSSTLTRHMSDADPIMAEGLRNQRAHVRIELGAPASGCCRALRRWHARR